MELVTLDQHNAGFDAAEVDRHLVNDGIEQLVELKDGSDLLRRPL